MARAAALVLCLLLHGCDWEDFKDTVIPQRPERLKTLEQIYTIPVKECKFESRISITVYMEESLKSPDDLWKQDALIKVVSRDPPLTIALYDRVDGEKDQQRYINFFANEAVNSDETFDPFDAKKRILRIYYLAMKKLLRIYPERDITIRELIGLIGSYTMLADNCLS